MLKVFSVRDSRVSAFARPFAEKNEIGACRALHAAVRDPESQLGMFPGDFDLFEIGVFDEVTGVIEPCNPPKFIVSAVSVTELLIKGGKNGKSTSSDEV